MGNVGWSKPRAVNPPDYVLEVSKLADAAGLQPIRVLPGATVKDPILICVSRNEIGRIPSFLLHYRELGVRRFAIIDNQSVDGTIPYLVAQPDVDVFHAEEKFNWIKKQSWIMHLIKRYGYGRWYLVVDADELVTFDGAEQRSIQDFISMAERTGLRRVRGVLVDMYRKGPVWDYPSDLEVRPAHVFPLFDGSGYAEKHTREMVSVTGGVRQRAFEAGKSKFNPELSKYPLFRIEAGEVAANPHHIWPYERNFVSVRYLGIMHFKFKGPFFDRVRQAVFEKNYWEDSLEYRLYLDVLKANPRLTLEGFETRSFTASSDFVSSGIIEAIRWAPVTCLSKVMTDALRRRRAELLF